MKICIISDSHDHRDHLRNAVEAGQSLGASAVLHCGDVVAPSTLTVLKNINLPIHVIHGNNTGDLYTLMRIAEKPEYNIKYYGQDAAIKLADRKIFMVHYPHYAQAMATTGDWDLVCCGHDHVTNIEKIDNIKGTQTLLVNPGTVGGVGAEPTFLMGNLETMEFEVHTL